jgi:integrase
MPSLHRRVRSPFWWANFRAGDGRRLYRSTKCTNRTDAVKVATAWEEVAGRRAVEAQCRRVLSDLHTHFHGRALAGARVREYVATWLAVKKPEVSKATLDAYEGASKRFLAFLGSRAEDDMLAITTADIASFRNAEAARTTPSNGNQQLKLIRVLFAAAWRDGLITESPAAKVKIQLATGHKRRPFTLGELKKIMAVANTEWRGMVLAGLYTAQRLMDIAHLRWSQIDLQENQLTLNTGKTDRRMILPIAAPLRKYLDSLPSSDDPNAFVFPIAATAKRAGVLSNQFAALLASAGLSDPATHEKAENGKGRSAARVRSPISFHSLRHTATSLLKSAGVPEAVVRDIVGHESAMVSQNYTHIDDKSKRSALAKMPSL